MKREREGGGEKERGGRKRRKERGEKRRTVKTGSDKIQHIINLYF